MDDGRMFVFPGRARAWHDAREPDRHP